MITSKTELKEYIVSDNSWDHPWDIKSKMIAVIAHYPKWQLKKYLFFLVNCKMKLDT